MVFALLFAVIGSYFIYRTYAYRSIEGLLHANGTLVQTADRKVYLIEEGKLRPVTAEVYQTYGYTTEEVRNATEADSELAVGIPLPLAEGSVVTQGGKSYQIESSNGELKKRLLEDSQRLSQLNTGNTDLAEVSKSNLPRATLAPLKEFTGNEAHPNGTAILTSEGKNYVIENNKRRVVPSTAVGLSHRLNLRTVVAENDGDRALPLGLPLEFKSGSVVKGSGKTIYVIEKTRILRYGGLRSKIDLVKRPIRSTEAFLSYGYKESDIIKASDSELRSIRGGAYLPQSSSAPVQVIITPRKGEDSKSLSEEYIKQGAKIRHLYPEWFSLEMPYKLSQKLKSDSSIQKVEGNIQAIAYCNTTAIIACGGPAPTPLPPDESDLPPPPPPPPSGQPPVAQTGPTLEGLPIVGQTLVSTPGSWANGVGGYI